MQKPVNITNQMLLHTFFFVITLFLIITCSQNKPNHPDISKKKNEWKPPVTIPVKAPFVTLLDTCPLPLTIAIPTKRKDSYVLEINNSRTVILPPEVKPADFMVLMNNYNTGQGLNNNTVLNSYMDKNGNLWFVTSFGGVNRYDGKSFMSFTTSLGLINNIVNCMLEDIAGNLWFGTNAGVSRYNGRFVTSYDTSQGLVNYVVRCMAKDKKGNLWFGTMRGISCFDGKSFKSYTSNQGLVNNLVNSIFQDKSGNLWFGTAGGVSRYDGNSFKSYTTNEGLVNNYVTSILEDKMGNIWMGTGGGVCRLDKDGSFKSYAPPMELANNFIRCITEDKTGNLWFGTNEGAFRLKGDGSLMNFNANRGLVNNMVNSILEDKTGNYWFCTADGISRFDQDGKFFVSYTTAEGLVNNSVWSFCEDKSGNLWIGTDGGISSLSKDGKVFTNYTTSQGLPNSVVRCITEDKKGNLWFGTDGAGAFQLDHSRKVFKFYTTLQGLPENSIRCITEDQSGELWFGSAGSGVSRLDQNQRSFTTYTTDHGLSNNSIRSITEDKDGNLWFSTLGGGICRLAQDRKSFTGYTTAQGLAKNHTWAMLEDKNGNLWVTGTGVSRFDGKSFTNYNTAYGLPDDEVSDIVMDKKGVIWLGTSKGFTALKGYAKNEKLSSDLTYNVNLSPSNKLSNAELENAGYKPVFEIYNNKTGYPGKGINANAMGVTREGVIWAGTSGFIDSKLISFDFGDVPKNPNPPTVFIQGLKINNERISWYGLINTDGHHDENFHKEKSPIDSNTTAPNITEEGTTTGKIWSEEQREAMREKYSDIKFDSITSFYPLPVNLILPYGHNNLAFDFAAIEPARPFLVRYQYMLEGYDKEWSPVTDQTSAAFGNMHEGRYIFKLKARSPDGVWSEPVVYSFKVLPPWQRTWWAYTLYALIFLTALWVFIKWRERTLKNEKILLEEKVAKRTHELQEEKEKVETTLVELKSTQAQLIQSEKMASLGEMTAGIAHEIQNPLNFVNNFSELNFELINELKNERIKENGARDEKLEEDLIGDIEENSIKINQHGKRADAIVKGMMQHSKKSAGIKELTDINALCDEYLRLAYHGLKAKDATFNAGYETHFDPELPKMMVIPQDFGRAILNMINNAFYAVIEKKKQIVEGYEPEVIVSTKRVNDKVEIIVKDNGKGIPENIKDKIFQPFFTTKPTGQGTGLGLSLAYDIVKAHSGELKVETKEGEGTEFIIQLPIGIEM